MTASDPWNLDNNLATIARQWGGLFALCDDEDVFRASAPTVSAWDVGQHVKHCAIALNRIVDAIEFLIANPDEAVGLGPKYDFAIPMLESGDIPRGMGKAIAFLIPEADPDRSDTRAMVEHAQSLWDGLSKRRGDMLGTQATFEHFALGSFTAQQWARFMPVHTAHHLKIVREILDAAELATPFDERLQAVG